MSIETFLRQRSSGPLVEAIETATEKAERAGRRMVLADLVLELLDTPSVRSHLDDACHKEARRAMSEILLRQPQAGTSENGFYAFDLESLIGRTSELSHDLGGSESVPLSVIATSLLPNQLTEPDSIAVQEGLRKAGLTVERLLPKRTEPAGDFRFESLGFGTDLTAIARADVWKSAPVIGLEREMRTLATVMTSGRDSVVLVGDPGVGKTALVEGMAYHVAHGTRPLIPSELDALTIVSISSMDLIAGTGGRGELEERLEKLLFFLRSNPEVVPFFDEMHTLLDAEDPTARSIATALKPSMAAGRFRCIGASTDQEYARFIANDRAMSSRFTRLLIQEPSRATAVEIVDGVKSSFVPERYASLGIEIPRHAVETVVDLTSTYQRSERLPRKALSLLRKAVAGKVYSLRTGSVEEPILGSEDVARTFSEISGIPADELLGERDEFYGRLESSLGRRVIGQPQAIEACVNWLRLHARGWSDPRRPRGTFLFVGPPGVGKTELAMALAEEVMRDRGSLVVKNMAEFQGEGARARFMGADPGYVGYGQVQTLYSQIMLRPYAVVVLDEFEKAHHSLGDPLLSVLSGAGEDSQGRWVDFSQCIFVLTSNALCEELGAIGSEQQVRDQLVRLGGIFQAPLVDRIDGIARFEQLGEETLVEILDSMIDARRKHATRPLPDAIDTVEAREQMLAWASEGARISARGLERALARWLHEAIDRGSH